MLSLMTDKGNRSPFMPDAYQQRPIEQSARRYWLDGYTQAPEASYRSHPKYPLGTRGPLEQITGNAVLTRLRTMATEIGVIEHTEFNSEVETIRMKGDE